MLINFPFAPLHAIFDQSYIIRFFIKQVKLSQVFIAVVLPYVKSGCIGPLFLYINCLLNECCGSSAVK
jgi:hypothetical protein